MKDENMVWKELNQTSLITDIVVEQSLQNGSRSVEIGWKELRELLKTQRELKRLEALRKNKNAIEEEITKTRESNDYRLLIERHQKDINELDKRKCALQDEQAALMKEWNLCLNELKMMSSEDRMRIRDAHAKDVSEEPYARAVTDILNQIEGLGKCENNLKKLSGCMATEQLDEHRFNYTSHLIEKIKLYIVILEKSVRDLTEIDHGSSEKHIDLRVLISKKLLLLLQEAYEEGFAHKEFNEEIEKLGQLLSEIVMTGNEMPKMEASRHLQTILRTYKTKSWNLITLFLFSLLLCLLCILFMKR
ncbi:unnamed protein product [Caenorhabditis sp. 36 PRJEB53466]|nr:unnamed protein product [Caenorhabditis sp. 36 PRJEB53466]